MQYKITSPENISGKITLPASKSISNRALILNALSKSDRIPENLANCDDTNVLTDALKTDYSNNNKRTIIDIGAAGTSMRFLTAFFASQNCKVLLTGTERMKNRPIEILVNALKDLGADISYAEKEGYPPLIINGKKLNGITTQIDGSVSSQYISALLMIGPILKNGIRLTINGEIISKPYLEITLNMLKDYGITYSVSGNEIYIKNQTYTPSGYKIESDWSAASYWYEILSIIEKGEITLKGLKRESLQGDSKVAELFEGLGVHTEYKEDGIELTKTETCLKNFNYDFTEQPDLAQTFAVTCALKNIPFFFKGLKSLKIKETDRIAALIAESRKLGFDFRESSNEGLLWDGERIPKEDNVHIKTYKDHRMAMAFAPAAITFKNISIEDPEVVNKSYPSFWKDLTANNFIIKEEI